MIDLKKLDSKDVYLLQHALISLGLYKGNLDGLAGSKTRDAYIDYRDAMPTETSEIDTRSAAALATIPDVVTRKNFIDFYFAANAVAAEFGCRFLVLSGYRSPAAQRKLYDAYKAGKGGKAAAPGYSWHEYGLAIDGGIFKGGALVNGTLKRARYLDDSDPDLARKVYRAIGARLAKKFSLLHGAAFGDLPHFAATKTHTPTAADRRRLGT